MNAMSPVPSDRRSAQEAPRSWQERRAIAYPLLVLLAAALVLRGPIGPTGLHDSLAVYWVWADQFTAEIARGFIYPRWLSASDAGLGTPVFYFYPPLAFYLAGFFSLFGLSTYGCLIATFGAAFAASGIFCWHWLSGRSSQPLLGAAFFMAAPYHLFNYTERGALAESVATALIPLLAIGMRRIADGRGGLALTAIVYAAIIGTHLPLALLVSLFLVAPYAIVHRDRVTGFVVAITAGIALVAVYLVPALALAPYHDVGQLYRSASLRTGYWSVFSANWSDVTYLVVFLILGALLVGAIASTVIRRDRWALHAAAVAILVSGAVPLVWSLPMLKDVQFPYRALPIAEFALATALARLPGRSPLAICAVILPLLASLIVLSGFNSRYVRDVERLAAVHPDTYEYLPKGVIGPDQTQVKLSDILSSRVPPPSVPGMVVEPHFYFPSWSCAVLEPRTQLLMHDPSCTPRIIWTWAEKLGAAISLIAALAIAALSLAPLRERLPLRRKPLVTSAIAG